MDMKELKLISPIPPSVNHYTAVRSVVSRGNLTSIVYKTSEAKRYQKQFKEYLLKEISKQKWDYPLNKYQHYYVDCIYYFDRVDKDPSNYDKCLLDSITETQKIWVDDNTALPRVLRIYYDKNNPRIEITIKPVEYIGIFNNVSHLNQFIDKCIQCRRYRDGKCSVLNNAKIGKIQKEIVDFNCLCYKKGK
jgi:Holliday junction resolvase RusA-like endonuclease